MVQKAIEVYETSPSDKRQYIDFSKVLERKGRVLFLMNRLEESIESYKKSLLENNIPKVRSALKEVEWERQRRIDQAYLNPELSE